MNKLETILENYQDEDLLKADGLDDAIIGVVYDMPSGVFRIAYSRKKCIEILMNEMEVNIEELEEDESIESKKYEMATEHFEYNVAGGYVGTKTPIWVDDEIFYEED